MQKIFEIYLPSFHFLFWKYLTENSTTDGDRPSPFNTRHLTIILEDSNFFFLELSFRNYFSLRLHSRTRNVHTRTTEASHEDTLMRSVVKYTIFTIKANPLFENNFTRYLSENPMNSDEEKTKDWWTAWAWALNLPWIKIKNWLHRCLVRLLYFTLDEPHHRSALTLKCKIWKPNDITYALKLGVGWPFLFLRNTTQLNCYC